MFLTCLPARRPVCLCSTSLSIRWHRGPGASPIKSPCGPSPLPHLLRAVPRFLGSSSAVPAPRPAFAPGKLGAQGVGARGCVSKDPRGCAGWEGGEGVSQWELSLSLSPYPYPPPEPVWAPEGRLCSTGCSRRGSDGPSPAPGGPHTAPRSAPRCQGAARSLSSSHPLPSSASGGSRCLPPALGGRLILICLFQGSGRLFLPARRSSETSGSRSGDGRWEMEVN